MKNNKEQVLQSLDTAAKDGLNQAAQIYTNNMKRALRRGYTSGDFVTGNLMNSVTRTAVTKDGTAYSVRVGTNLPYALYWELGFHSIYSRKYERQERWRPTLMASKPEMGRAIQNAFKRVK